MATVQTDKTSTLQRQLSKWKVLKEITANETLKATSVPPVTSHSMGIPLHNKIMTNSETSL